MVHALILTAIALAYGAAWAVWRRTYGGGDGWLLRVAGWAPFLWKWEDGQKKVRRGPWLAVGSLLTVPVWFILPPWQAAVAAVSMMAPPVVPSWWLVALVLVGPLTALGYAKARMEKPRPRGQFLDGWSSWGELVAGFALGSMAVLALAGPALVP